MNIAVLAVILAVFELIELIKSYVKLCKVLSYIIFLYV